MAFPIVALATFGAYAYAIYWYASPGAGYLPEGKVNVPEWIGDLSLALPVVATVLYLSMCYFGPKIMARREAFDPKGLMLVKNGYQTFFNVVTVVLFVAELRRLGVSAWWPGSWTDPESAGSAFGIWLHYNNKYPELLDTVFKVVRKKSDPPVPARVHLPAGLGVWMVCSSSKTMTADSYRRRMNAGIHAIITPITS